MKTSNDLKDRYLGVRLSSADIERLKTLAKNASMTEAETIRALIRSAQYIRPAEVVFTEQLTADKE